MGEIPTAGWWNWQIFTEDKILSSFGKSEILFAKKREHMATAGFRIFKLHKWVF
jgi:hypothetical protein